MQSSDQLTIIMSAGSESGPWFSLLSCFSWTPQGCMSDGKGCLITRDSAGPRGKKDWLSAWSTHRVSGTSTLDMTTSEPQTPH